MHRFPLPGTVVLSFLGVALAALCIQAEALDLGGTALLATNQPPKVQITFPGPLLRGFAAGGYVQLKAIASNPDGSVQHVQFFFGTNLVGLATSPPYSVLVPWPGFAGIQREKSVKAVAVDDLGTKADSDPVLVTLYNPIQFTAYPVIISPRDGAVFPAPATFEFAIDLMTTLTPPGHVPEFRNEFTVATNKIFATDEKPNSITITNLPEGDYTLGVIHRELFTIEPDPIRIHVTKCGIRNISRTGERVRLGCFDITGNPRTVVQASSDLREWVAVATNSAATARSFYYSDQTGNQPQRFYRLMSVPP